LSPRVLAPARDASAVDDRTEVLARGELDDVRQRHADGLRRQAITGRRSELAEVVLAPAPDLAVVEQHADVVIAAHDQVHGHRAAIRSADDGARAAAR